MRWEQIWERQRRQQIELNEDPEVMTEVERAAAAKDLLLGLHEEANALSRTAANYKAHVLRATPVDRSNVLEDAVDVLKYAIAIAQLYGITADEAWEQFMVKSDVVAKKAVGERSKMESHTKVFITDMDGCVADLSELDEACAKVKGTPEQRLMESEMIKFNFRASGGFADLPPIKGAPEALREIKNMGYSIVVITARPHHRHKRLYADTLNWMKKHDAPADLILFERDKAEAICEYVYPAKPLCFVEDRAKHAMEIAAIGVPVLLLGDESNKDTPKDKLIQRVANWADIVEQIQLHERNDI
jgi:phosphoglycolate phosphatase-like HAD superfamily hydrolase